VHSFGFANPASLTVYYRQTTGQGLFLPQSTSYNPITEKLSAQITFTAESSDLRELIFGYPDLADIPFPPLLDQAENYRGAQLYDVIAPQLATTGVTYSVNQTLPILLSWSPKGFARYYQFQISTNADFSTSLVSVDYQTDAYFVLSGADANTTYFYRAKTVNEGGQSDWAVGSFNTVPPSIGLAFPKGGEALQRGLTYFIRWHDNLAENITLGLYKGGVFIKTIATNAPSTGAYSWQLGFDLSPGSDYSIRISSATNAALFALSAANFSIIDAPLITPGSVVRLSDGRIQFGLTAPGAAQVSVLVSTNLSSWQLLQNLPITSGSAVFTDDTSANQSAVFYRLRVP
jgi:hypothetical protein